ncbi:hypothetical protein KC317_g43 [Hortaea werneckii]|nr:hypothetical protein KC317_g43 [Hortaea werneckii]
MGPNVLRTPPSSSAAEDKRSRNDQSTDGNVDASSPGLVFRGQQSRGSGGSAQRDGAETRWGRGWEDERTVDRRRRGYGVMAVACFLEHSSGYDSHLVGWKRELRGHLGQVGTNVREGASVGSQRVFGKAEVAAGRAWMGREKYGPTTLQHPVALGLRQKGSWLTRQGGDFRVRIKERYCLLEEGQ